MAAVNISALRNTHKDERIWIVASGASLNFVPKNFFESEVVILINETYRDYGHLNRLPGLTGLYAFAHHRETAQEGIDRGFTVVASEYCRCDKADGLNVLNGNWYQYRHPQQPTTLVMNMKPFIRDLPDSLVVGSNTVTSAMDFAGRILGARAVVLCGVDSGTIDGRWNYDGYNKPPCLLAGPNGERCGGCSGCQDERNWEEQQTQGGTGIPHVRAQVSLIQTMADALRSRGVAVCSLNPFVDLGLESHVYDR